jgi:hypothetical protein
MCVENGLTFDEMVKVVKHLIFWDLGKLIYPITSQSVVMLTDRVKDITEQMNESFKRKLPGKNLFL